jgi:hypothetical protein
VFKGGAFVVIGILADMNIIVLHSINFAMLSKRLMEHLICKYIDVQVIISTHSPFYSCLPLYY